MVSPLTLSLFTFLLILLSQAQSDLQSPRHDPSSNPTVCIIGSGIGGSSVAHFLRLYSSSNSNPFSIRIFERNGVVGGRMAIVNVSGEIFEAGASILHPKNFYAVNYTKFLGLKNKDPPSSSTSSSFSLGIWDGKKFPFKTLSFSTKLPFLDKIVSLANDLLMFVRYGFSLLRMQAFVEVCFLILFFFLNNLLSNQFVGIFLQSINRIFTCNFSQINLQMSGWSIYLPCGLHEFSSKPVWR